MIAAPGVELVASTAFALTQQNLAGSSKHIYASFYTMVPEAVAHGNPGEAGLSTLAGLLAAVLCKLLEQEREQLLSMRRRMPRRGCV